MNEEIITSDWSNFGYREIELAKELLSHIKEIDNYGKVEVMLNTHSGCVFLSDEDYKTWMMNGDVIEEWYSCPYCGYEGFLEDMEHEAEDEECTEYMRGLGILKEEDEEND